MSGEGETEDDHMAEQMAREMNDNALEQLRGFAQQLLGIFKDDGAFLASQKAIDKNDITVLRNYMVQRNADGYNLAWAMLRYIQNLEM